MRGAASRAPLRCAISVPWLPGSAWWGGRRGLTCTVTGTCFSDLAEAVLPHVEGLATTTGATVRLLVHSAPLQRPVTMWLVFLALAWRFYCGDTIS